MPLTQYQEKPQKKKKNILPFKKIIGIHACKGGVGKSTISAHLAYALSCENYKTALLDADLYGPSQRILFPSATPPYLLKDGTVIPAKTEKIEFFSYAFLKKRGEAAIFKGPQIEQWVEWTLNAVHWKEGDFLFIDLPPGTGEMPLAVGQKYPLDGVCLISMPGDLSLIDLERSVDFFNRIKIPIIGLVENFAFYKPSEQEKTFFPFGKSFAKENADKLRIPFLGAIPLDERLKKIKLERYPAYWKTFSKSFLENLSLLQGEEFSIKITSLGIELTFSDLIKHEIKGNDLQKMCSCARCKVGVSHPQADVKVLSVEKVGKYAFKCIFSEGCSSGIYPLESIRNL